MTYVFKCLKCGETFELNESLAEHEKHRESCPKCNSREVQQQFGSVQVQTARKS